MRAAPAVEKRRRAEILVGAVGIDIRPERARVGLRALAGKIGAAFDERRAEAHVEPDQHRLGAMREQPVEDRGARPDAAAAASTSTGAASPASHTASAIPLCRLPFAPDQSIAAKRVKWRHFFLRGFTGFFAAVHSRERSIIALTRSGSALS